MTGKPTLDFWFDFASTYSYPAAMRIAPLAQARGVALRWRPFLLGPIFKAQGWDNSPFNLYAAKGRYMWRDLERICGALDLPFARPAVFPQNSVTGGARGAGRTGARLGRGLLPRGLRVRIRRRPQHRRAGNDRRRAGRAWEGCRSRAARRAIRHDQGGIARANRGGAAARHFRCARFRDRRRRNCSGATTGWKPRSTGRIVRPTVAAARASARHCGRRAANRPARRRSRPPPRVAADGRPA